jgi:hypothetical protein
MAEGAEDKRKLSDISSFIADLPATVQKFWSGVAEPFFELSIALIVIFFALGGEKPIPIPRDAMSQSAEIKALISDGYGVKALIPVAVLIFLIGIAQGVSKLLRVIGAAIPGQLVPDRASLTMQYAPPLELIDACRYNPARDSLDDLNNEIDSAISRVPADPRRDLLANIRVLQGRAETIASTASFVKGLAVVTAVISFLLGTFESWPIDLHRLGLIFALALVALAYLAFGRVQAEREYAKRKVREYNSQKETLSEPIKPNGNKEKVIELSDEALKSQLKKWKDEAPPQWKLNFVPPEVGGDLAVLNRAIFLSLWRSAK